MTSSEQGDIGGRSDATCRTGATSEQLNCWCGYEGPESEHPPHPESTQSGMEVEFSRLAWELARRARLELDETRPDRPIRAIIGTVAGDVKAWGRTHTEAMRNLAYGLDQMAADWAGRPITESVATGQTITVTKDTRS